MLLESTAVGQTRKTRTQLKGIFLPSQSTKTFEVPTLTHCWNLPRVTPLTRALSNGPTPTTSWTTPTFVKICRSFKQLLTSRFLKARTTIQVQRMKSTKVCLSKFQPTKVLVHLNTNFAYGPSFEGIKFKKPSVPFSTQGEIADEDKCDSTCSVQEKCQCTHMRKWLDENSDFLTKFWLGKIPLGSIVEMTITSYNWNAVTHSHHPVSTKVWYVRWLYTSDPLTRPRNVRHGSWLRPVQWNNSPNGKFNPPAEGKTDLVQVPGGFNENFECIDVYNKDGSKKINCPQTRKTHNREFELNYVNPVKRTTVPVPNNGS